MAAEQLPGRTCECNCGRSLDGLHGQTRYAPECRRRRKQELWRKRYQKTYASREPRVRNDHKTPHPHSAATWQHRKPTDAPHVPTLKCHVCCDMPWARQSTRSQKEAEGCIKPVATEDGTCRGCGGKYAPEPKPEFGSVLRSSAGTMQKASELWGYQPSLGGAERTKAYREAKKAKGQSDG